MINCSKNKFALTQKLIVGIRLRHIFYILMQNLISSFNYFLKVLSLMFLHLLTFLNCSRLLRIVFGFHRIISSMEKLLSCVRKDKSQVFCSLPPLSLSLSLYLSPTYNLYPILTRLDLDENIKESNRSL